jgi:hypothetical protein
MSERTRFDFIVQRDGLPAALRFERESVVGAYRETILFRFRWFRERRNRADRQPTHGLYRRGLIERYVEAKRILREHKETPC